MSRNFTINPEREFFIFDTRGDVHGVLLGGYLYDMRGEYIGYVRNETYDVYTSSGEWVGNIWPDGRIVRKRNFQRRPLDPERPTPRPKVRITARVPLPPMAADLGFDKVDVLEWDDEIFKRISDLTPDLE